MLFVKRFVVLAAIVVAVGVTGWACNGDGNGGGQSLESYFAEVQSLDEEFNEDSEDVFATEPSDIDEARSLFDELLEVFRNFADDLDDIDAPEEAEEAHERAVEAGRDLADGLEGVLEDAQDLEGIESFFAALSSDELNEASERFSEACRDLLEIAEDNGIDVTLDCGEDA